MRRMFRSDQRTRPSGLWRWLNSIFWRRLVRLVPDGGHYGEGALTSETWRCQPCRRWFRHHLFLKPILHCTGIPMSPPANSPSAFDLDDEMPFDRPGLVACCRSAFGSLNWGSDYLWPAPRRTGTNNRSAGHDRRAGSPALWDQRAEYQRRLQPVDRQRHLRPAGGHDRPRLALRLSGLAGMVPERRGRCCHYRNDKRRRYFRGLHRGHHRHRWGRYPVELGHSPLLLRPIPRAFQPHCLGIGHQHGQCPGMCGRNSNRYELPGEGAALLKGHDGHPSDARPSEFSADGEMMGGSVKESSQ
jgi:hypothetical protein